MICLKPIRNKTAICYFKDILISLSSFVLLFDFDHITRLNFI